MRFDTRLLLLLLLPATHSFLTPTSRIIAPTHLPSPLSVSIGTGDTSETKYDNFTRFVGDEEYDFKWNCEYTPKERGVVEPDHELYRKTRLRSMDVTCDEWFEDLLGDKTERLGRVSTEMWDRLHTPVELVKDPVRQWFIGFQEDEEWSPFGHYRLPGEKIYPAFGLENYGLPVVRQLAETWRHFDVPGLVRQDYSLTPEGTGTNLSLDSAATAAYQTKLIDAGGWTPDDECTARLVYINGRFAPSLSKTTSTIRHLSPSDFAAGNVRDEILDCLARLPEGHTDELATEEGQDDMAEIAGSALFSGLSGPDHNFRRATSQHAINYQQGMASFCALNSVRTGGVALVDAAAVDGVVDAFEKFEQAEMAIIGKPIDSQRESIVDDVKAYHRDRATDKPIIIVNAIEDDLGFVGMEDGERGVAVHPRTLIVAGKGSKIEVVQQCVDFNGGGARARFYNGVTQAYVRSGATLSHCYVDETGGQVTANVEKGGSEPNSPPVLEANRSALRDAHFETIDVHLTGRYANYAGTKIAVGGSGKVKIAAAISHNQKYTFAKLNGMLVSGGAQNTDMRAFVHHISPLGETEHNQRNVVGGCADATWKGRIRMDSQCNNSLGDQMCKTLLLSDSAHILAMPTLDACCESVRCGHGSTVADLNDDQLIYMRCRGLDKDASRNLLMYGFVDEIGGTINRNIYGRKENGKLRDRILRQLANLVPKGDKKMSSREYTSV